MIRSCAEQKTRLGGFFCVQKTVWLTSERAALRASSTGQADLASADWVIALSVPRVVMTSGSSVTSIKVPC